MSNLLSLMPKLDKEIIRLLTDVGGIPRDSVPLLSKERALEILHKSGEGVVFINPCNCAACSKWRRLMHITQDILR